MLPAHYANLEDRHLVLWGNPGVLILFVWGKVYFYPRPGELEIKLIYRTQCEPVQGQSPCALL